MRRFLRQHTKRVSSALLSLFVIVLSVTCLAQEGMTESQMACCAAMASGCSASMGQDHSCCRTESSRLDQQLAASPRLVAPAPEPFAYIVFGLDAEATCARVFPNEPETSPPITARPAYLTLSVFRV